MSDLLQSVDAAGVARLTLNRPERRNAFDDGLIAALGAALRSLANNGALRGLVLTGSGESFCAGGDLDWMRRAAAYSPAENLLDATRLAALFDLLDQFPCPTVALVQGACYGGGVGLAACCDIVIAADDARFCFSEVRLGLSPATISPYAVAAIGARQARRYFATAEVITADRAREIGLAHDVVAGADLEQAGTRIVAALLAGAPGAERDAKRLVLDCQHRDPSTMMAETAARIAGRRAGAEAQQGIAAFLAKQAPPWRPA